MLEFLGYKDWKNQFLAGKLIFCWRPRVGLLIDTHRENGALLSNRAWDIRYDVFYGTPLSKTDMHKKVHCSKKKWKNP